MRTKEYVVKIICSALILTFVFGSFSVGFAANETPPLDRPGDGSNSFPPLDRPGDQDQQAKAYLTGGATSPTTPVQQSATGKTAAEHLGCTAGGLLARVVASGISTLVNGLVGAVTGSLVTDLNAGAQLKLQNESGGGGANILGMTTGVTWDGIAFCIVNSMISYVADATIRWANTGFNGNPAFVQNPENFFKGLADQQASQFIQELAYDTTGMNVCKPFRAEVAIALANSYSNNSQNKFNGSCTLQGLQQNVSNSLKGGIGTNIGQFSNWNNFLNTSRGSNNKIGAYMEASDALSAQIAAKNNTAQLQLNINKGFLSFSKCEDPEAAKKGDTRSCKIYTPGTLIQSSLEKSLNLPKDRLVLATKFDQVVTAIVNNLIKVALNKVLTPSEVPQPAPKGLVTTPALPANTAPGFSRTNTTSQTNTSGGTLVTPTGR